MPAPHEAGGKGLERVSVLSAADPGADGGVAARSDVARSDVAGSDDAESRRAVFLPTER